MALNLKHTNNKIDSNRIYQKSGYSDLKISIFPPLGCVVTSGEVLYEVINKEKTTNNEIIVLFTLLSHIQ